MKLNLGQSALIAAVFLFYHPGAHSGEVCDKISSVVKQSRNGFAEWRGSYNRSTGDYNSTYLLPNANECFIYVDSVGDSTYQCSWEYLSEKIRDDFYNELVGDIKLCSLGGESPTFKVRQFPDKSSSSRYAHKDREVTYLTYEEHETYVDIKIAVRRELFYKKKTGEKRYELDVDIERSSY